MLLIYLQTDGTYNEKEQSPYPDDQMIFEITGSAAG
jgi:hypothetical protein